MPSRLLWCCVAAALATAAADQSCPAGEFPMLPIAPPLETLTDLKVHEYDVFVCSWPKSGTTWMQAIVAHLVAPERHWAHVSEVTPFYDVAASWDGAAPAAELAEKFARTGRRCWNTHLLWSLLPKGARYVYVVRDQRDALVSFWHHLRNQRGAAGTYEGSLEDFAAASVSGKEPYGSWAAHLADWAAARLDHRVLVVRYADLKRDPASVVAAVARHLEVRADAATVARVVRRTSFAEMRADRARYDPKSVEWAPGFSFLRKGESGDGDAELSDAAKAALDADRAKYGIDDSWEIV